IEDLLGDRKGWLFRDFVKHFWTKRFGISLKLRYMDRCFAAGRTFFLPLWPNAVYLKKHATRPSVMQA
ncbi:MAG: hypothetical protein PVH19_11300, partial [Planctomycetia bacterium]